MGEVGLGVHLLGDTFAAAQTDLEQRGFRCGQLQTSADQPTINALACERANPQLTPPADRVSRVELSGSRGKITHVNTRFCGSETRPCPTPQATNTPTANPAPPAMAIPPQDQPTPPSVIAAFSIFSVIMTAAWCLDWRHYIRFGLGQTPNDQGRWALAFRLFFAFAFLSSIQGAIHAISSHSWTFKDCKYTAFWLLVITAAFAVLDSIFRFRFSSNR